MSAPDITLHIGAMKTGTTYIQRMLGSNEEALAAAGILYPLPWSDQVEAVRDVLNLRGGGAHLGSIEGRWEGMVERVQNADCTRVILSVEFLSFASDKLVKRIARSLAQSHVQVVLGARDLGRALPAQWQTSVRNGRPAPYRQYAEGVVLGKDADLLRHFWKRQNIGEIASRWGHVFGIDNVTVVTVPPQGANTGELWSRFARAMDLQEEDFVERSLSNQSLGPTATELLRRINEQAQSQGMQNWVYQHGINRALSHSVLPNIQDPHPSLRLPDFAHDWAKEETTRLITEIAASGASIIGSLDDLQPNLVQRDPFIWPEEIPDSDVLDLAVAALTAFGEQMAEEKRAGLTGGDGRRRGRKRRRAAQGIEPAGRSTDQPEDDA